MTSEEASAELRVTDIAAIEGFLLKAPHVADGGVSLMGDLVARLRERGLPLWRCTYSLLTMHPEVFWRNVQWHEEAGVKAIDRHYDVATDPFYGKSPIALLHTGSPPIRLRLDREDPRFPIGHDLKARGATDYYAQGLEFSNGQTSYVSWATRRAGGFTDETVRALDALTPTIARRLELESSYHGTRALLEVYLGKNAARRVLAGAFRRGGGEIIHAAIWFCDLRDFTAMSDRATPQDVVKTLDAYFDRVAGAVMEEGGEVLKFVGDAILAIFPVEGDAHAACRSALVAAEKALAALRTLSEERTAGGESALEIGVALHLGQVMYGNIGARERLDFTVISSSVNEACRLEALCKALGTPITLSEAFVKALGAEDVVDLGEHALKGVKAKARVFSLPRYLRR